MSLFKSYPQLKEIQDLAKKQKKEVYLVGGFLRDHVLKLENTDFDFAVSKDAMKLAESFSDKIKGAYIPLDEEHGCARVAKKINDVLYTFDFADFKGKTFKDDLSHRDFTINTLSLDLMKAKEDDSVDDLIEDNNRALKDIKSKRIKRVSVKAFREDPLRMLRAFSIQAQLDFRMELSTLNQIKKDKKLIQGTSYERIREEFFKVLESPRALKVIKSMELREILEEIIPQIHVMRNCKQGGYHHLDVWPHTLEALNQFEMLVKRNKNEEVKDYLAETIGGGHTRLSAIKFALLMHDIGKPDTRVIDQDGRTSFHNHENVGKAITKAIAQMMKLSTAERYAICNMVQMHLRPGYLSNHETPSDRMVYRFFRDAGDEGAAILLLSLADQRATRGAMTTEKDQKHHEEICLRLVDEFFIKRKEVPYVPLVNGKDLMKKFKIDESPLIGEILETIREKHVLGEIKNKKEAYELAEKSLA